MATYNDDIETANKQKQTNADVAEVKKYLYYDKDQNPDTDSPKVWIRSQGPIFAKNRLDERGVDTQSLITGKASANEGYKKGGKVKSKASKRADGCCEKGHTKGRVI